uniref:superoxide dismutase n=1 Tax=Elaeis guineensis var. tenera TaxID=51953 RepID=A0A6J0PR38_ELAGV|nr:superoxide dismutase [Cu-Zn]-like [Elaeis guineensis]
MSLQPPPASPSPGCDSTKVIANISGLKRGLHGFHIHALGDTTNSCMSTGLHFNPIGKEQGAPEDENRHAGDLGNVTAGEDRTVNFSIIPLSGLNSIIGRAGVVHADPDNLNKGSDDRGDTNDSTITCSSDRLPNTKSWSRICPAHDTSVSIEGKRAHLYSEPLDAETSSSHPLTAEKDVQEQEDEDDKEDLT